MSTEDYYENDSIAGICEVGLLQVSYGPVRIIREEGSKNLRFYDRVASELRKASIYDLTRQLQGKCSLLAHEYRWVEPLYRQSRPAMISESLKSDSFVFAYLISHHLEIKDVISGAASLENAIFNIGEKKFRSLERFKDAIIEIESDNPEYLLRKYWQFKPIANDIVSDADYAIERLRSIKSNP